MEGAKQEALVYRFALIQLRPPGQSVNRNCTYNKSRHHHIMIQIRKEGSITIAFFVPAMEGVGRICSTRSCSSHRDVHLHL